MPDSDDIAGEYGAREPEWLRAAVARGMVAVVVLVVDRAPEKSGIAFCVFSPVDPVTVQVNV